MIVGARLKATHQQALLIGWHARNLHYVKDLKPIGHYLRPAQSPDQKREQGARDVLAMMKRAAKKGKTDGAR